jgi:predicted NUDIX family NTP pyrophosphohydrolase
LAAIDPGDHKEAYAPGGAETRDLGLNAHLPERGANRSLSAWREGVGERGHLTSQSAGIVLYRVRDGRPEVLLVHPGGPFWANKDLGAWSIPKGEFDEGEDPLAVARRELEEETGLSWAGVAAPLESVKQPGGKIVHAWAGEGDFDPSTLTSNTFPMEWPPRSGRTQEFPEVDRAEWFDLDTAREKLNRGQVRLLDQLVDVLRRQSVPHV